MKILFIGGNGNISWHCVQKAIEEGHNVTILNRGETAKTRRDIQQQVKRIICDIRNFEEAKEVLRDHNFDVVADFICYNKEQAELDISLFRDKTKQFIFVSSTVVYKRETKFMPFKETSPKWEQTDYSYAFDKILAEQKFIDAYLKFNFPVTIVRPAHTYDTIVPTSVGHNCFTACQRYLDGKPVLIAGDGTNLWTLTHSSDFAEAFINLFGKGIGDDFQITGDEFLTWLDITNFLLDALKIKNPKILHIPLNDILAMDIPNSNYAKISYFGAAFRRWRMFCDIYDNAKIKKIVPNWKPKISFQNGIKETINWLQAKDVRKRINPDLDALMEKLSR